jgi:hypothetical protein
MPGPLRDLHSDGTPDGLPLLSGLDPLSPREHGCVQFRHASILVTTIKPRQI